MTLFNLTSHDIVIEPAGGSRVVLPPTGQLARLDPLLRPGPPVDGIAVVLSGSAELVGLPAPRPGLALIVSTGAAKEAARQGRLDVYAPDTSLISAIRDQDGIVRGVRRLVSFAESPGD